MDNPGTHSPDPDAQPVAAPLPEAASVATPEAPKKTPFLAMSWPRRRRIGAALAVVAIATTGGVAIAATSGTPSPEPAVDGSAAPGSALEQKQLMEKKRMAEKGDMVKRAKGMMQMHGFGVGPGGAIYGEFVTPDGDGYATHLMQTGTVSSVGDSSLEVKSADGHTQSYVLNSDTIVNGARGWTAESKGGVATGQTVTVVATKSGDKATANTIMARDAKAGMDEMRAGDEKMRMFKFRGGPGGMARPMPMPMPGEEGEIRRFEMGPGDKMVMPREMPAPDMRAPDLKVPAPAPNAPEAPEDELASPSPSSGT